MDGRMNKEASATDIAARVAYDVENGINLHLYGHVQWKSQKDHDTMNKICEIGLELYDS